MQFHAIFVSAFDLIRNLFIVNLKDLKYEYVQHLPALTITLEVNEYPSNLQSISKWKMKTRN